MVLISLPHPQYKWHKSISILVNQEPFYQHNKHHT
jgi:hypothetical protein